MFLDELAETSKRVAATPARREKIDILAASVASMAGDEIRAGVSYLAGVVPQGALNVGYAALQSLPSPDDAVSLTLGEVHAALNALAAISGSGSATRRAELIESLFAAATPIGQEFLVALLLGGLRQGANEKPMIDAVAKAAGIPAKLVRRAVMFTGDIGEVAEVSRLGRDQVAAIGLHVFRPIQPMLAKTAADVAEGLASLGAASVERKLDGARIQAHLDDGEVRLFTRNLNDVTDRLPEVVTAVASLPAKSLVLDGEAIAIADDGAPRPFQVTMARFGSEAHAASVPLRSFFFDVLHIDGRDTFDLPLIERQALLSEILPPELAVARLVTDNAEEAQRFFDQTVSSGHEGVVLKSLDAPYEAGRRGAGWLKVKPVHTLDLVVLAVEWGSGRRRGWLSNIHLGARAADGSFVMLGKTFKGMTDAILEWQTERFLELETHREGHIVYVRPEQVVEVAFDGVQVSSRYPGGVALRFARVKGYRNDKEASEADTIEAVRALL